MQLFCEWYALYQLLQVHVCTSSDGKTPYPPAAITGLVDLSTDGVLEKTKIMMIAQQGHSYYSI